MDLKLLISTFGIIFLAELGDKTQLAILAFAAESKSGAAVFIGSSMALVLTSFLAVVFGAALGRLVPANYMRTGVGSLVVVLGLWILFSGREMAGIIS